MAIGAVIATHRNISRKERNPRRSEIYEPSAATSTGLHNSAGCSLNSPSEIHRCEPRVTSPIGVITMSSRNKHMAYMTTAYTLKYR